MENLKTYDVVSGFYARKYRLPAYMRKIVYVCLVLTVAIFFLTLAVENMVDYSIKAQTLNNLVKYHNADGFQLIK